MSRINSAAIIIGGMAFFEGLFQVAGWPMLLMCGGALLAWIGVVTQ